MPYIVDPIPRRGGYDPGRIPLSAFGGGYAELGAGLAQGIGNASGSIADAIKDAARLKFEESLVDKRGQWEERLQGQRIAAEERSADKQIAYQKGRDKQELGSNMLMAVWNGSMALAKMMEDRHLRDSDEQRAFQYQLVGKMLDGLDRAELAQSAERNVAREQVRAAAETGWKDAKTAYDSIVADLGTPKQALNWLESVPGSFGAKAMYPNAKVANPFDRLIHVPDIASHLDARLRQAFSQIDATNAPDTVKDGLKAQIVQDLKGVFSSGEMLTQTAVDTSLPSAQQPFNNARGLSEHMNKALDWSVNRYAQEHKGWNPWQQFKFSDAVGQLALQKIDLGSLPEDQKTALKSSLDFKQQQIKERIEAISPTMAARMFPAAGQQPAGSPGIAYLKESMRPMWAMAAKYLGMEPKDLEGAFDTPPGAGRTQVEAPGGTGAQPPPTPEAPAADPASLYPAMAPASLPPLMTPMPQNLLDAMRAASTRPAVPADDPDALWPSLAPMGGMR